MEKKKKGFMDKNVEFTRERRKEGSSVIIKIT
jgi:hypothetical protein